jgi:hypothetical protein
MATCSGWALHVGADNGAPGDRWINGETSPLGEDYGR